MVALAAASSPVRAEQGTASGARRGAHQEHRPGQSPARSRAAWGVPRLLWLLGTSSRGAPTSPGRDASQPGKEILQIPVGSWARCGFIRTLPKSRKTQSL